MVLTSRVAPLHRPISARASSAPVRCGRVRGPAAGVVWLGGVAVGFGDMLGSQLASAKAASARIEVIPSRIALASVRPR
jgi:hypothetical protein